MDELETPGHHKKSKSSHKSAGVDDDENETDEDEDDAPSTESPSELDEEPQVSPDHPIGLSQGALLIASLSFWQKVTPAPKKSAAKKKASAVPSGHPLASPPAPLPAFKKKVTSASQPAASTSQDSQPGTPIRPISARASRRNA